ncbi:MAG TPA: flagellar export chaperone FliS [Steroidobacteraceae bacterium]|jgi:flagellin-specific chaperone FliS
MPTAAPSRACASHSIAARGAAAMQPWSVGPALLDSALERVEHAREHLEEGRFCEHSQLVQAAVRFLEALRSSLDLHAGEVYAANLDDLCEYISRRLAASRAHNRVATLDEVSHLLREIRAVWLMYV